LCDNDEHLMSKLHNNLIFSLCDSEMVMNTFLRIAKEDAELYKDGEVEVRLVLTEIVHNSDKIEILEIFNPVIKNLKKFDFEQKFASIKGAM
jgi:hypothetical protein